MHNITKYFKQKHHNSKRKTYRERGVLVIKGSKLDKAIQSYKKDGAYSDPQEGRIFVHPLDYDNYNSTSFKPRFRGR